MNVLDFLWRYGWFHSLLITGLIFWIKWSLPRQFVTHAYLSSFINSIEERMKQFEKRQTETENLNAQIVTALAALPTASDLHRLEVSLTGIDGAVKASQAEVRGMGHSISRIERVVDMFTESHIGGNG